MEKRVEDSIRAGTPETAILDQSEARLHMDVIRSAANPSLKRVRAVAAGREPGLLLLEGARLVGEARRQGCELEVVLLSDARPSETEELASSGAAVRLVQDDLLQRLSRLERSPGVIALARRPRQRDLADLDVHERTLLVVSAGVQDPGNLGALARAAEAAGAQALVSVAGGCSPWNDKAVRGSMGSLLRLPVYEVDEPAAAAAELGRLGLRLVRAATRGGSDHRRFDWSGPVALWFSAESGREPQIATAFESVTIAMAPDVESLNVSCAAAVLLFSAGRAADG